MAISRVTEIILVAAGVVFVVLASMAWPAGACTPWATAGSWTEGGGVLVAKNRDVKPALRQELRWARPPGGFRFIGLWAVGPALAAPFVG